jgi:carbon monoxide dehydrogenase subunit G
VVDERIVLGSVKVKLGAITTSYKGRVQITEMDQKAHSVKLTAEGRETSGGTAKGTLNSQLRSLPDGRTEVLAEARVDLTGRVMQMGRGMIQGVSHQLFQQFVASTRERLEAPPGAASELAPADGTPIRAIPLLLATLRAAVVRFFRRLFGTPDA